MMHLRLMMFSGAHKWRLAVDVNTNSDVWVWAAQRIHLALE